eukprot:349337-Rhodomonas_salina.1
MGSWSAGAHQNSEPTKLAVSLFRPAEEDLQASEHGLGPCHAAQLVQALRLRDRKEHSDGQGKQVRHPRGGTHLRRSRDR